MTRNDLRIFCTALGFTAVVTSGAGAQDQAKKAQALAALIEEFCCVCVPDGFTAPQEKEDALDKDAVDRIIDQYKTELVVQESARLPSDRALLVRMYDRLLTRKTRAEQRAFYETAPSALIADQILCLVENEIAQSEAAA